MTNDVEMVMENNIKEQIQRCQVFKEGLKDHSCQTHKLGFGKEDQKSNGA